jgi:hypothetical protein
VRGTVKRLSPQFGATDSVDRSRTVATRTPPRRSCPGSSAGSRQILAGAPHAWPSSSDLSQRPSGMWRHVPWQKELVHGSLILARNIEPCLPGPGAVIHA